MLTEDEREWIVRGMAWVGLRGWLCGAAEAEKARVWFQEQMDVRFCARTAGRHITPDMVRLEAEFGSVMRAGLPVRVGLPALIPVGGPGA